MKWLYSMILCALTPYSWCSDSHNASAEIIFGISGSFSGHFGYYGNAIKHGIEAYFNQVNAQGGIHGKKLKLIALDDNGNADRTQKNIATLMQQGITMFIGIMGTRGLLAMMPLIKDKKIAVFFPWGGHPSFRDPALTNIINGPGLLEPQLDALNKYVTNTLKLNKFALFYADDDFSTDGATYLKKTLEKNNLTVVAAQAYDRFTMDIYNPTLNLIKENPRVVISIATSLPTAKMIDQFFVSGAFGTHFLGTESTFLVADLLRDKGVTFKFSSPVPNPKIDTLVLTQEYKNAMNSYFPSDDVTTLSFTYYICAAMIGEALRKISGAITTQEIIKQLESMKNIDLKGFPINFDATNRYAFGKQVWII